MLQTKINECIRIIDIVQANKERKEGNETIAKRNNRFFDAFAKFLVPIATSLNAIKALSGYSFSEELYANFRKYLTITETALSTKSIVNPEGYYSNLFKLNIDFSSAWKDITKMHNESLLDELAILRIVQSESKEIQQIYNCINNIQNWPVSSDVVKLYIAAKIRGEELLSEMKFDDDIKEFLQKVKNRQASLIDLNEKVLNWIKAEKFESKFAVRLFG